LSVVFIVHNAVALCICYCVTVAHAYTYEFEFKFKLFSISFNCGLLAPNCNHFFYNFLEFILILLNLINFERILRICSEIVRLFSFCFVSFSFLNLFFNSFFCVGKRIELQNQFAIDQHCMPLFFALEERSYQTK